MDSLVTLKTLRKRAQTLSSIREALEAEVTQFLRENRGVDFAIVADALGVHLGTIYAYAKRAGITLRESEAAN
jgi:DNA-directed RNA polymerase specialized sigma54-like protein